MKGKRKRTNEEIVAAYQAGSKFAAQDLWDANTGMVYRVVQRTVPVCWREDAMQEAYLMLMKCADDYQLNHESGAKFITWAYRGLRMYLVRWVRRQRIVYHSRNPVVQVSLTKEHIQEFGGATNEIDGVEESLDFRESYERVSRLMRRKLDLRDRDILRRRASGQSLRSIGRELGLCGERVRQREERSVKKLRLCLGVTVDSA